MLIAFRIPVSLRDALRAIAEADDRSVSSLIVRTLRKLVQEEESK